MVKYIPLNQNILQAALQELDSTKCLLLFPTRKSKREAQKLFQPNWNFSEHKFLTMDEWKEEIFHSKLPILKEEKRTLMFYRSLTKDNREFFRVKSYFQSIELANNFFNFWDEINEEMILEENILDIFSSKHTANNWQLDSFEQLSQIKEQYYEFLSEENFSDKIFLRDFEDLHFSLDFDKIIVVNQFYFTSIEKKLLNQCSVQVVILSQIPEECFDEGNLSVLQYFNAEHLKPFFPRKLQVHTSSDQIQMIAQMVAELPKHSNSSIIDFQFEKQPYAHLLSSEYFSSSTSMNLSNTRCFRFFQILLEILNSIIWEGKPFLISMQSVLSLVSSNDLLEYFVKNTFQREAIRSYCFKLIDNDFKYIDLDIIHQRKSEFVPFFEEVFSFLKKLRTIESISGLVIFIDKQIDLKYLLDDLKTTSDIAKVFYESLADFVSIEEIEIIDNWKNIFSSNPSENILKLFLDYLKPKKLKLKKPIPNTRFDITTLQDTRNLTFENLFVLNVVEGVLPDRKHTQFLFSENQRKELGLKTYEDIKLRDKFYFYRLLCNCQNTIVFTRNNLEENVEVSSFLEELKLFDLIEEKPTSNFQFLQKQLFANLLKPKNLEIPNKQEIPRSFFAFPFDKNKFPDNKLSLSFYKWEKMKNNAFEYYLEFISGIRAKEAEIGNDFSSKLIGTIAHEVITLVWERLIEVYQSNEFKHNFINNTKLYVQQSIEHFLEYNRDFQYISPHNFSDNYFRRIFLPILSEGIENFFYRLHNELLFSDKKIEVFPETERSMEKCFTKIEDFEVYLKGRPDLRIHAENQKYIFDFKTGTGDSGKTKRYNKQLQFYENICYLIDLPTIVEQLNSYLFFIEQKDMKHLTKRIELKDEVKIVVEQIINSGYDLSLKADKYEDIEITRRDLYKNEKVK
jgi:hypothetical protein